jgi:ParB/RepB/Spo0J family partition protein
MDTQVLSPSRKEEVHKPCAFNPNGADRAMCTRLSGVPARAVRCEETNCTSVWRVQGVAKVKGIEPSTAEIIHRRNVAEEEARNKALVPASPVIVPEEESNGWQDVLARVKAAMASSVLVSVDPSRIRPMPGQPRDFFSESGLASLRQSIRQVGQIQAGIIREVHDDSGDAEYELLDGERRWRAVCQESIPTYRAQLVVIDDVAAPYMVAAIANFNREGHTPTEISDAIHKLRTGPIKVPLRAVAEIFGFTELWAGQMHGLQNLHPEVRAMLQPNQPKDKILPLTAAIHISKLDADLQLGLAVKVQAREISLARLRAAVVETGLAHGKPVRTREIEPRKALSSFENRCGEAARLAEDMIAQVNSLRARSLMPRKPSPHAELLHTSIVAAIRDLSLVRDALEG